MIEIVEGEHGRWLGTAATEDERRALWNGAPRRLLVDPRGVFQAARFSSRTFAYPYPVSPSAWKKRWPTLRRTASPLPSSAMSATATSTPFWFSTVAIPKPASWPPPIWTGSPHSRIAMDGTCTGEHGSAKARANTSQRKQART